MEHGQSRKGLPVFYLMVKGWYSMEQVPEMKVIAHIRSDFPTKFGIPRQSGLVKELQATIVFEPEYRNPDAFRGLEAFTYIWLIWEFSGAVRDGWSPTVRPPRLGGNARMGVFATRSPFRPNPIGLSSVRLEQVEFHPELGPVLHVSGADLMDGTPIFDIKPYVPYVDSHPEAAGGFASTPAEEKLEVSCDEVLLACLPEDRHQALLRLLAYDPRPPYQKDPNRIYGLDFAGCNIRFSVQGNHLTVHEIKPLEPSGNP